MNTVRNAGNRVINGTFGTLWVDGEEVFEIESFEATVSFDREDVTMAGNMDVDSKVISQTGEGSFEVKKVYSRGLDHFMDIIKSGQDVRSQIVGKLKDPDTEGGQAERIAINNVWFNEFTLMNFEMGEVVANEFPFGFTPSSVDLIDEIRR